MTPIAAALALPLVSAAALSAPWPLPGPADIAYALQSGPRLLDARVVSPGREVVCDGDTCRFVETDDGAETGARVETAAGARERAAPAAASALPFCDALCALLRERSEPDAFRRSAGVLLRVCENLVSSPTDTRFRRISCGKPAFSKHLAPYAGAIAALNAVGFARTDDGDAYALVDAGGRRPPVDKPLLAAAARFCHLFVAAAALPAEVHAALPAACRSLESDPQLLESLAGELNAPHALELISHGENAQRVGALLEQVPPRVSPPRCSATITCQPHWHTPPRGSPAPATCHPCTSARRSSRRMARGLATWHAAHLAVVALHVARPPIFTRGTPSRRVRSRRSSSSSARFGSMQPPRPTV